MKLPNIMGVVSVVKTFAAAHRPEILLGASVTSTIASTVLAAVGGYKSGQQVLKAEFLDLDLENDEGKVRVLTPKEKAQLTWTNYIPAAAACTTALGSTAGLHLVHVKDKKALVTAGAVALEEMKAEFKKFEEENTVGAMSNEEKQKILEERADKVPIGQDDSAHVQNSDGVVEELYLVRDGKTGRDIWSSENRIEEAINGVNAWIAKHGDCELNTFYSKAGFANTPDGDDWGWSGDFVEVAWSNATRDDGRPVRVFAFRKPPKEGYSDTHA